ncbi:MAG: hypothetical protein QM760_16505 [Nibricoccus sp.]
MKRFLRLSVLLAAAFLLSGCVLAFRNKEKGNGLEFAPRVVLPIPQSGQIPIK